MSKEPNYFEVLQRAFSFLESHGLDAHIAEYLMMEKQNWSKTELILNFKKTPSRAFTKEYQEDLIKISQHMPVQYLIGSCEFYGRRFLVNENTLIPRPETEELVDLILKENKKERKYVVDIGTGSGVIAISLQLERPEWEVVGVDISKKALEIAEDNKRYLNATLTFFESDVLSKVASDKKIDLIVSNPPYISQDEWSEMDESVRTYEPKEALFADGNGLAVYERIAKEAKEKLGTHGKIYLEIGYRQAFSVMRIFKAVFPEKKIAVIKDLNGQDRMIKVT